MKEPNIKDCTEVSQLLKILSHPQRLLILCHMAEGPKNVSELEELSGATQSAVSQFLSRMKLEGVVDSTRYNRLVYYEIKDRRVKKLIQSMHKIFC